MQNKQWRLKRRPVGMVEEADFEWREEPAGVPGEGEVLVRIVYLSLDPANRGWLIDRPSYLPPVGIGEVMRGLAIGVVEQSEHPGFAPGDIVQGVFGWQQYAVVSGRGLNKLPKQGPLPLTAYLGLLGHIGFTAYFGLLDVGKPQAGETLVVSAAAGATGSIVGQIGKIHGCRVVGLAGSEEKCRWIRDTLGFDAAINYKTEPLLKGLQQQCPQGIDIYFDNVGGDMLEAALALINQRGRVVLCGMIAQYNTPEPPPGPRNLINLLVRRARIEGFIVLDYASRFGEAAAQLGKWMAEGKLQYRVDVVRGLENAPRALNKLFDGSNQGKLIVQVSEVG